MGSHETRIRLDLRLTTEGTSMDPERARELLAAERARLERLLGDSEEGELTDLTDDQEHLGDAELEAGLAERLQDELAALERAEERLAAGTYGLSVESGKPIPDARLEFSPTAELTVEEQAVREGR
jgi:DnaK suppressor protein